jgi:hypothetical protein
MAKMFGLMVVTPLTFLRITTWFMIGRRQKE